MSEAINKKDLKKQLLNFRNMSIKINDYLKEEGFSFSMLGYVDTLNNYFKFVDNYLDEILDLINEINLWMNLLNDMEGFIEFKYFQYELELDIAVAKNYNPKTEYYENLRKKKVHFNQFLKQIKAQKMFFKNANWHCSKEFNQALSKNIF